MFGDESVNSFLVCVVIADVNKLFCLEEDSENPFAIRFEFIPWHDEHVAVIEEVLAKVNIVECT